jgi:hypothetical protein
MLSVVRDFLGDWIYNGHRGRDPVGDILMLGVVICILRRLAWYFQQGGVYLGREPSVKATHVMIISRRPRKA